MSGLLERARPHVLLGGLCVGLASANVARPHAWNVAIWVGALGAAAWALERPARTAAAALALAGIGVAFGSMRLHALDRSVLQALVGHAGRAVVEVTGPARRGEFSLRIPARALRFQGRPVGEPVLLELPRGRAPPQGVRLRLTVQIRSPRGPEDGFDERGWLRRQGVHVVLRARSFTIAGRRGGLGGAGDRLRRFVERGAAPGLHGERRAVILGVVLGADEGLSKELQDRFRRSGLYHLLAVSGQNVAIIAAAVLALAWFLGVARWLGELAVLAAIAAYVLAVGLQPSVVRAGIAGGLASLAWLASRPRDRWYFLLVAAAVLLAWNPYSLLDPGFQLSFAAVAAIFVLVPRIQRRVEGYPVPAPLVGVLSVSFACGLVTAPILWLDFGRVPIFSVLANALAEPAVAFLLGLGLVSAVIHPLLPGIAASLAWVNGWLAAYLAGCARLVGVLPGAQLSSVPALLALVGTALFVWAAVRRRRRASA